MNLRNKLISGRSVRRRALRRRREPSAPEKLDRPGSSWSRATPSVVKIEERDGFRYITANGIPDHVCRALSRAGQPECEIAPQKLQHSSVPLKPTVAVESLGVVPRSLGWRSTASSSSRELRSSGTATMRWHYEALTGMMGSREARSGPTIASPTSSRTARTTTMACRSGF